MQRREEYAGDTVQRKRERLAVIKDVPILPRKEEFVSDMVQSLRGRLVVGKGGVCIRHGASKALGLAAQP